MNCACRIVVFACCAALARAQPQSYLSGFILDVSEAGIPGALVTVVNEDSGFRRVAKSELDGRYVVAALTPGVYKITVRKEGFRSVVRFGVRVEAWRPARVSFSLPVGSMQETITVEGDAPMLHREDAAVGAAFTRDEVENLPLNGRSVLAVVELAPGTVATPATRGEAGQFTANGQRPNTHYFTVDGVSANTGVSGGGLPAQVTGGALPGMSAFGSLHTLASMDALQELRVQTSSTAPEFGRLPGANVALNSRSGTADFRGTFSYAFRHERLAANDRFANRYGFGKAPLRLHDASATLGGPLRRDRTFAFFSYEAMRLRQPFAWMTPVPSAAVRQTAPAWARPVLNLFPAPNGAALGREMTGWSGRNHRPSSLDAGSLRIDHAVGARFTLFGRYHQAPSANEFGSAQVNRLELRARSLTLGANLRPRPGVVLDTRLNASKSSASSLWMPAAGPLPECALEALTRFVLRSRSECGALVRFSVAGMGQVVSGDEGERRQSQYQVLQAVSARSGGHSMRFGGDYRRLAPVRRDAATAVSVIAESLTDLDLNGDLWTASAAPRRGSTVLREFSLSAQDTWQATPRLTAVYGFRWEISPAPAPHAPVYFLDPRTGVVMPEKRRLWPRSYVNLAPRLGLAWGPGQGRIVLRAGAGLYYDSSLSLATDLINGGPLHMESYGSSRYAPFSTLLGYGFMPNLRLPLVAQWSAGVEHSFGERDAVSVSYAGSSGRRLVRREMGGPGSSEVVWLALATNHGSSDYHGLQFHYHRRMGRGLQALASYTWAHSLDDSSSDALLHWAGAGSPAARDWGSSDFDVRQAFHVAFSYESPALRGWALDGVVRARTGFPVPVLASQHYMGISFANAFRPDLVPGQPLWIGGRLNRDAFRAAPEETQGGLGRNVVTGFGMSQWDLALRRQWRAVEVRLEAFNVLNQAILADPIGYLASPLFGQPLSMLNLMLGTGSPASGLAPMFQSGGARSVQATVRLRF
ncbi:MAG: TonB-dependent receptor domain-containing protein [Bryobacteraceae bacterium]